MHFAMATLLVPDYASGIEFFVEKLGFNLNVDAEMGGGDRWVEVSAASGAKLRLAKARNDEELAAMGNQAGGRVGFFLSTTCIVAAHERLSAAKVRILEELRQEPYGKVVVFADPFGNRWDLIEPKDTAL